MSLRLNLTIVLIFIPFIESATFASLPLVPFRLKCPKSNGLVGVSMHMINRSIDAENDILFSTACDNILKMTSGDKNQLRFIKSLPEQEDCRWTAIFDPGKVQNLEETCFKREYMSGISRIARNKVQFQCCNLPLVHLSNCRRRNFPKPTNKRPVVQFHFKKTVISSMHIKDGRFTVLFCRAKLRNFEDINKETTTKIPNATPNRLQVIIDKLMSKFSAASKLLNQKTTEKPILISTTLKPVTRQKTRLEVIIGRLVSRAAASKLFSPVTQKIVYTPTPTTVETTPEVTTRSDEIERLEVLIEKLVAKSVDSKLKEFTKEVTTPTTTVTTTVEGRTIRSKILQDIIDELKSKIIAAQFTTGPPTTSTTTTPLTTTTSSTTTTVAETKTRLQVIIAQLESTIAESKQKQSTKSPAGTASIKDIIKHLESTILTSRSTKSPTRSTALKDIIERLESKIAAKLMSNKGKAKRLPSKRIITNDFAIEELPVTLGAEQRSIRQILNEPFQSRLPIELIKNPKGLFLRFDKKEDQLLQLTGRGGFVVPEENEEVLKPEDEEIAKPEVKITTTTTTEEPQTTTHQVVDYDNEPSTTISVKTQQRLNQRFVQQPPVPGLDFEDGILIGQPKSTTRQSVRPAQFQPEPFQRPLRRVPPPQSFADLRPTPVPAPRQPERPADNQQPTVGFCTKRLDNRNLVIACGVWGQIWRPNRCPEGSRCIKSNDPESIYSFCCDLS